MGVRGGLEGVGGWGAVYYQLPTTDLEGRGIARFLGLGGHGQRGAHPCLARCSVERRPPRLAGRHGRRRRRLAITNAREERPASHFVGLVDPNTRSDRHLAVALGRAHPRGGQDATRVGHALSGRKGGRLHAKAATRCARFGATAHDYVQAALRPFANEGRMGGRANGRQHFGRPHDRAASGARGSELAEQAAAAGLSRVGGGLSTEQSRGRRVTGRDLGDQQPCLLERAAPTQEQGGGATRRWGYWDGLAWLVCVCARARCRSHGRR